MSDRDEQQQIIGQIEVLEDRMNERLTHSSRRYDILLNAICAGGLIFIYSFITDIGFDKISYENKKYLLVIGSGFTLTILINFYSIYIGNIFNTMANGYVMKVKTETLKMPPINIEQHKHLMDRAGKYEKVSALLGKVSIVLMTASVISIAIFLFSFVGI